MGYVRGFVHGTVIGAVAGLCVAPQTGKRTRQQLSAFGNAAKDGYELAERTVRKVTPMMSPLVSKLRHVDTDDEAGAVVAVEGTVRIHDQTNGHAR